jgi:hypothetical protein
LTNETNSTGRLFWPWSACWRKWCNRAVAGVEIVSVTKVNDPLDPSGSTSDLLSLFEIINGASMIHRRSFSDTSWHNPSAPSLFGTELLLPTRDEQKILYVA